jgi:hypothetical protein
MPSYVKPGILAVPFLLLVSNLCAAQAPVPEPFTDQETERSASPLPHVHARAREKSLKNFPPTATGTA